MVYKIIVSFVDDTGGASLIHMKANHFFEDDIKTIIDVIQTNLFAAFKRHTNSLYTLVKSTVDKLKGTTQEGEDQIMFEVDPSFSNININNIDEFDDLFVGKNLDVEVFVSSEPEQGGEGQPEKKQTYVKMSEKNSISKLLYKLDKMNALFSSMH
jgi:hypothetical protein